MADINYDESGKPKTVNLSWDEYCQIKADADIQKMTKTIGNEIIALINDYVGAASGEINSREPDIDEIDEDEAVVQQPSEEQAEPVPNLDIRRYQNAIGYYKGHKEFCVLKGSKANGYTSDTFDSLKHYANARRNLIDNGILARDGDWGPYTFTRDYVFSSSSKAASIIDGNSRSGPEAWGRP